MTRYRSCWKEPGQKGWEEDHQREGKYLRCMCLCVCRNRKITTVHRPAAVADLVLHNVTANTPEKNTRSLSMPNFFPSWMFLDMHVASIQKGEMWPKRKGWPCLQACVLITSFLGSRLKHYGRYVS